MLAYHFLSTACVLVSVDVKKAKLEKSLIIVGALLFLIIVHFLDRLWLNSDMLLLFISLNY